MKTLRLILGDQLSASIATLADVDENNDIVMLCEVMEEATYVKHHQQKIAFLFAAMRHFASDCEGLGMHVHYVKLDAHENTGSFDTEVLRAIKEFKVERLVLTEPGEHRVLEKFKRWQTELSVAVEIRDDTRFFCTRQRFKQWVGDKTQFRMEYFYRDMRRSHNLLMNANGTPTGGKWNFDKENREPIKSKLRFPQRPTFKADAITREVMQLVGERFKDHFGTLEKFHWAVTRKQALKCLTHFVAEILPDFGEHQDAMQKDEAFLYHSVLSPYLNAGLLLPREVCQQVEAAYRAGRVPLNSAEGFIRQILGWREYMRGVYWLSMPAYAEKNYLAAQRPLPDFYWTAETEMNCLREVVTQTREFAYSHHIQRLMVTGNFALLAGILPSAVCEWYLIVYADAYEWVELTNTLGMSLYGDGGLVGSKPYAASGKYIQRMSNFCEGCVYNPKLMLEDNACPFNSLYWDFMQRNQKKLRHNLRLTYAYSAWDRMAVVKQRAILEKAKAFLASLVSTY